MLLSEFDFDLPEERIAKFPVEPRDHARLMVLDRARETITHSTFKELPQFLSTGDRLVFNNTKVLPARLFGESEGREYEILLLEKIDYSEWRWKCLARPAKKLPQKTAVRFAENYSAQLIRIGEFCELEFPPRTEPFEAWLARAGSVPLPPYLRRGSENSDLIDYQTIFAKESGSVAAPTAGLHFTFDLMGHLSRKGIDYSEITLNVGYGTFSPIRVENIENHEMHAEEFRIEPAVFEKIRATKRAGHKIVAVGTTSVRSLESVSKVGERGRTSLFIRPGYAFECVDAIITNFHTPKSSLLVLVSTFAGIDFIRRAYCEALEKEYRFFSYGDGMLIL